ncbi:hypothetical protein LR48_Vigan2385s000100 [Vigna angularis]|nr:hypothetical protein LR48_Vigan2385s000100 [Vigna angularis]
MHGPATSMSNIHTSRSAQASKRVGLHFHVPAELEDEANTSSMEYGHHTSKEFWQQAEKHTAMEGLPPYSLWHVERA